MRERAGWALLLAIAATLHLVGLDERPMHHDESQEAWLAWRLAEHGEFVYDPVWHGPLPYYLDALAFLAFGVSDAVARVPTALVGTAIVAVPLLLRHRLGRAGALAAGVLLLASPTLLYYGRFSRADLLVGLLTLLLVVVADRWWRAPRPHHLVLGGALLAALFATKESAPIVVGLALALLAGAHVARRGAVARRLRALPARAWLAGLIAFWAVFALLFTVGGTDPGGFWRGLYVGPKYWLEQHEIGRGEAWWSYLVLLAGSEAPIVVLAAAGAALALRGGHGFAPAVAFAAGGLLAAYSLAGERFPWLATHPLVLLALAGGVGVQQLFDQRRRAALALAAAAVAALGASAVDLALRRPEDPRDLVVSVQTTPEAERVRDRLVALLRRPGATAEVDTSDGGAWPWGWWLRGLPVAYVDMRTPGYRPTAPLLIVGPQVHERLRTGGDAFVLRAFWPRARIPTNPSAWWHYLVRREPWSPLSGYPQWLVLRETGPARPSRSARRGP